jgi:hypothetical protein
MGGLVLRVKYCKMGLVYCVLTSVSMSCRVVKPLYQKAILQSLPSSRVLSYYEIRMVLTASSSSSSRRYLGLASTYCSKVSFNKRKSSSSLYLKEVIELHTQDFKQGDNHLEHSNGSQNATTSSSSLSRIDSPVHHSCHVTCAYKNVMRFEFSKSIGDSEPHK